MRSVNTLSRLDAKPVQRISWTTPRLRLIPLADSQSGPSGADDAISNFS